MTKESQQYVQANTGRSHISLSRLTITLCRPDRSKENDRQRASSASTSRELLWQIFIRLNKGGPTQLCPHKKKDDDISVSPARAPLHPVRKDIRPKAQQGLNGPRQENESMYRQQPFSTSQKGLK